MGEKSILLWTRLIEECLIRKTRPEDFDTATVKLYTRSPISGKYLAELLLRPRSGHPATFNSAIQPFLDHFIRHAWVDSADVLNSLFRWTRIHISKLNAENTDGPPARTPNCHQLDEIILNRLVRAYLHAECPRTPREVSKLLTVLSTWLTAAVEADKKSVDQAISGVVQSEHDQNTQQQDSMTRQWLSQLLNAVLMNIRVAGVLQSGLIPKGERKKLAHALSTFVSGLDMDVAARLSALQKEVGLNEESAIPGGLLVDKETNDLAVASIQLENIFDPPADNTRAGLFIFLDALISARPLTDETTLLAYLNNRFKGDVQSLVTALIVAAFDTVCGALERNESADQIFNSRSLLVNKIPTLLAVYSISMFPPLTIENCIQQAWISIEPHMFPPFSQGFDLASGGNNTFSDIRTDFLVSCALHGLIPAANIERLHGEPLGGLPQTNRYVKDNLVAQCTANSERVEELLKEAELMNGNAGPIVLAVAEIIRNLCHTSETMSLKAVCNGLSRRPRTLDVMMQFTSPSSVLQPLSHLLDAWRLEEDQGEYQPVYEEFGAILLLVLAIAHRYGLSYQDIGLKSDSFVSRLLERGHLRLLMKDLSADQEKHLDSWTKGLYDPDGMNDELFSSCRPQDFYLVLPTLLDQTIVACLGGALAMESVQNGAEFLLEAFLLPSLAGALTWLTMRALRVPSASRELQIIVQVFTKLIRPSSISGEAKAMHGTILATVSKSLDTCFRTLMRNGYPAKELEPLIERIKPHLNYERLPYASSQELANPTNLVSNLRSTIQSMETWSSTMITGPPAYSSRLLHSTILALGTREVLYTMIRELKTLHESDTHTGNRSAWSALDIVVSIICAPSATPDSPLPITWLNATIPSPTVPRSRLNLRDTLKEEQNNAAKIYSSDQFTAETLVRLHRRVEAQLALSLVPNAMPDLGVAATAMLTDPMDIAVGDPSAVAAAGVAQGTGLEGLDLSADPSALMGLTDLTGADGTGAGVGDLGDLGGLGDMDMNMDDVWGGLDMTMGGDDDADFQF